MKSQYRREFETLAAGGVKNRDKMQALLAKLQAEGKMEEFLKELGEDEAGQEVLRDIFGGFETAKQEALTDDERKDFDKILGEGGTEQYWQEHPDERQRLTEYMQRIKAHAGQAVQQAQQDIRNINVYLKLNSEDRAYLQDAFKSRPLEFVQLVTKWQGFIQSEALTVEEQKDLEEIINGGLAAGGFIADPAAIDPYGWRRLSDDYLLSHPDEGRRYRAYLDKIEAVIDSGKRWGLVGWCKVEEDSKRDQALLEQMMSEVDPDKSRAEVAKWLGLPLTATDAEVMAVIQMLPRKRQTALLNHYVEVLASETPTGRAIQKAEGVKEVEGALRRFRNSEMGKSLREAGRGIGVKEVEGALRRFRNSEMGKSLREAGRGIFEATLLIVENHLRKRAGLEPKKELSKPKPEGREQSVVDRIAQEIETGASTEELAQKLLDEAEARFKRKFGDSRGKEMRNNLERRLFKEGLLADEEF